MDDCLSHYYSSFKTRLKTPPFGAECPKWGTPFRVGTLGRGTSACKK
jgi:hypothetical protein